MTTTVVGGKLVSWLGVWVTTDVKTCVDVGIGAVTELVTTGGGEGEGVVGAVVGLLGVAVVGCVAGVVGVVLAAEGVVVPPAAEDMLTKKN